MQQLRIKHKIPKFIKRPLSKIRRKIYQPKPIKFVSKDSVEINLENVKLSTIKECATHSYQTINTNRSLYVSKPNIIYPDSTVNTFKQGRVSVPDTYLAQFNDATAIEACDLILLNDTLAAYDELAMDPSGFYGQKIGYNHLVRSRNLEKAEVNLHYYRTHHYYDESAIHFCKDYSPNYFHWLIESLPRIWIIDQFPEFADLPLIVDNDLHKNQIEALQLMTGNTRQLIFLAQGHGVKVKHLVYPSSLSQVHNNYAHEITHETGVNISPFAIHYVRNRILSQLKISAEKGHRKIYISRKNLGPSARFVNSEEIENYLVKKGYEVICPETLSFTEQVQMFASAGTIVAPAGAALANLIFAPSNCKVFAFCTNFRFNPYVFHSVAEGVGCKLYHVIGEETENVMKEIRSHNSYKVSLALLKKVLKNYT